MKPGMLPFLSHALFGFISFTQVTISSIIGPSSTGMYGDELVSMSSKLISVSVSSRFSKCVLDSSGLGVSLFSLLFNSPF